MADSYIPGEKKIRPGAHYHIGKKGTGATAGAVNGVTAVLFRADFGPLCTAVEMSSDEDYTDVFGDALTPMPLHRPSLAAQRPSSPCVSALAVRQPPST